MTKVRGTVGAVRVGVRVGVSETIESIDMIETRRERETRRSARCLVFESCLV